jgi:hypothetical protein
MTTASEADDHGTPQDRQAAKLCWLLWMAVAFIGIGSESFCASPGRDHPD